MVWPQGGFSRKFEVDGEDDQILLIVSLQFSCPERFQFYKSTKVVFFNCHASVGKKMQWIYTLSYSVIKK